MGPYASALEYVCVADAEDQPVETLLNENLPVKFVTFYTIRNVKQHCYNNAHIALTRQVESKFSFMLDADSIR